MDEVTKDQLVDEVHIPVNREQRLDLFIKLGKWGLNSYLYAPKVKDLCCILQIVVISQAAK